MSLTLRRAFPGENRPDDFVIRHGGRDVGRLYKAAFAGEVRWQWTVYIDGTLPRLDGVPISGLAESFEEAKDQFKASFEKMAAAVVRLSELKI
jgi:hypothetical protein